MQDNLNESYCASKAPNGTDSQVPVLVAEEREITKFLNWFESASESPYLDVVCIDPAANGHDSSTVGQRFHINDRKDVIAYVRLHNARKRNVYWLPNASKVANRKPRKTDMAAAYFCWADCDPDIKAHGSYEAARRFLLDEHAKVLAPHASLIVDSGNGLQAFFTLAEPCEFSSADSVALARYESINKGLGASFLGPSTFNVDRVMRFPGTMNWPSASKLAKGYPTTPSMSRIVADSTKRYALSELAELSATRGAPAIVPGGAEAESDPDDLADLTEKSLAATNPNRQPLEETPEEAKARLDALLLKGGDIAFCFTDDSCKEGQCDRSALEMRIYSLLVARNFTHDNIRYLMELPEYDIPVSGDRQRNEERAWRRLRNECRAIPGFLANADASGAATAAKGEKGRMKSLAVFRARMNGFIDTKAAPRRFVIDGLLPLGITAVLAGAGGTGKSMTALQMAMSIATGEPLFGRFEIHEQGSSLLLFAEDEDSENHLRLEHALSRLAEGENSESAQAIREAVRRRVVVASLADGETDPRIVYETKKDGWVPRPTMVQDIIDMANEMGDTKLIVLDPLSRFRQGDENDNDGATEFIRQAERIARETGATVLISAHTNKGAAQTEDTSSGSIRGASGISDGARMAIIIRTMTPKEATEHRVGSKERMSYVRLDTGKFNYGRAIRDEWVKRDGNGYLEAHSFDEEEIEMSKVTDSDIHRTNIMRLIRDAAARSEYFTNNSLREKKRRMLGLSDHRMRGLLDEMVKDGLLVSGPHPEGLTIRGKGNASGFLSLGPNAPTLPADADELEVAEEDFSDLV